MNKEELIVEVVILKQIEFKDNDAIINAISSNGEYFSFFAKGIRKPTSKNASALQPFMQSEITYFNSTKNMYLLKSAKVKKSLYTFSDYNEMIAAHIVLDVINDITNMSIHNNEKLYDLLVETLTIVSKDNLYLVLSIFLVKVMNELGIKLVTDKCAICGSTMVNYISVKHGGFICHHCLKDNDVRLYNVDLLKLFRVVNSIDYDNIDLIKEDNENLDLILSLIYEFYISYSGFRIKNIKEFI